MRKRLFFALLLPVALFAAVPAAAQFGGGPEVSVRVAPEQSGVTPGGVLRVAVTATLSGGWHVNAHKPLEDYLIPTELKLPDAAPLAAAKIAYPAHSLYTFSFSPEPVAVYEQTFTIGVEVLAAADAAPGVHVLRGALRYQACNDKTCAPPAQKVVEIPVTVVAAGGAAPVPDAKAAELLNALPWAEAVVLKETAPAAAPAPAPAAEPAPTPEPAPAPAPEPAPVPEPKAIPAPAADWKTLADGFKETGRLDGYANTRDFLAFIDAAESGKAEQGGFKGKSIWLVMLLVLAGGLALNLTPCVLPLIPINIAIIGAGARAGSRARGFLLGGAYGLGITLVYGALGLVVVLGVSTAFGAINATVWFNAVMAVLFVLLGLAMFDVVAIDFSRFQSKLGIRGNERGSMAVALVMGAVSALLAGACVAPVVIYTILHAQDLYSQGGTGALALPFLLGAGMALPWPFLGAGLSFLPKPGKWMSRVKQAFGVFILAFALYYGHLAWTLSGVSAPAEKGAGEWTASLEEGLARAKSENKPVIIDFWATWCKNCTMMDNTVLKDGEVLRRLGGYVKIKYQAESPEEQPAREVVERFKVLGLPAYVILKPEE